MPLYWWPLLVLRFFVAGRRLRRRSFSCILSLGCRSSLRLGLSCSRVEGIAGVLVRLVLQNGILPRSRLLRSGLVGSGLLRGRLLGRSRFTSRLLGRRRLGRLLSGRRLR